MDPTIFAVSNIDAALRVNGDAVRDRELARCTAGFAPGEEECTIVRKLVDARVSVAIRDIQCAGRSDNGFRGPVEGRSSASDRAVVASIIPCIGVPIPIIRFNDRRAGIPEGEQEVP